MREKRVTGDLVCLKRGPHVVHTLGGFEVVECAERHLRDERLITARGARAANKT